ncbi:MAG: hypothetical protein IPK60_19565 [Sandaracinaceae bacterium]|nr:hypothetical protein [Sandaracinaceae bacterium]
MRLFDRHSCAQLDTSEIVCWGDNSYGQLGDGTKSRIRDLSSCRYFCHEPSLIKVCLSAWVALATVFFLAACGERRELAHGSRRDRIGSWT